ncbi:MAG: methylenetetrahydrofolate--tRNA-(uracil(54)-C(5))-methyltransferase (FADH(2)-oxidizing) TrmFO [Clostridiales bacterium]|nr:methylenetetrahydrofolate--tRNA-(uracil(54)-C(5))-methyltransferase (FADH(2)-oxidizing) TrmFO [Clostridiales bacterium]
MKIDVIGAGLAGCECAMQIADRGFEVNLIEMKPIKKSPAHHSDTFAELVCSNSLKSNDVNTAGGLLKEELRIMGSHVIECADKTRVPAGGALAVDRDLFSQAVTEKVKSYKNITVINKIAEKAEGDITVFASGPLTDEALLDEISRLCKNDFLHFFDAAAPIITYDSIDFESAFISSRYDKGTDDYINCPMNKEEFEAFWNELVKAETAHVKDFEENMVFEGCMPIEVMAKRGMDTIRFGPLKPVGLVDPRTGRRPWAVLQLRKENNYNTMYNLVGFQTHLTWPEQRRVFCMIPALKNAEFVRYGVMHKNTYINSPDLLDKNFAMVDNQNIYFAGQISGVEGYVESIASGLVAGLSIVNKLQGKPQLDFSTQTITGALSQYISSANGKYFQPMNANFGILDGLDYNERDKQKKKQALASRSVEKMKQIATLIK